MWWKTLVTSWVQRSRSSLRVCAMRKATFGAGAVTVRRVRHRPVHPLSVHSAQPFDIAVLGKHLGLEPAHGC